MVKEPDRSIALRAIADALTDDAFEVTLGRFRSDLELLLPHLPVVASWAEEAGLPQAVDLWQYFGNYWFWRREYHVAQSLYERAYDLSVKLWGDRHEVTAICQCNLGKTHHALGEEAVALNCYEAAIPVLLEASKGFDATYDPRPRAAVAFALNDLGALLHKLEILDRAKKCLETARLILKDLGGDYTRFLSTVEYHYGMLLCDLEEWRDAQDHLLQALCADGDGRVIEPPEVARIVESLRQVSARLNGD
jgi:tetratricopeptide (TPR) repeat protein